MDKIYERYQRQVILPQFGEEGQHKLLQSRVLVIGAGGLGCPALQYLAAAGTGTLGIVDNDIVSLSNLHRQILFSEEDIDSQKATVAAEKLRRLNTSVTLNSYTARLTSKNALELINEYDIILDCTDNFATRYMINDACVLLKKILVFGAIAQFEGQLSVFNLPLQNDLYSTNYRDLFPVPPAEGEIRNCAEAGVIGVLPGIIGTMMATETIKLVTGIGKPLVNQLLTLNLLNYRQNIFTISPNDTGRKLLPVSAADFVSRNYELACGITDELIINRERFLQLMNDDVLLTDVREYGETPVITDFETVQVPLSEIDQQPDIFTKDIIILFCQSGKRSMHAAKILQEKFGDTKKIYSLQNGITDIVG